MGSFNGLRILGLASAGRERSGTSVWEISDRGRPTSVTAHIQKGTAAERAGIRGSAHRESAACKPR
ncbi:hypothetical protein HPP92_015845 [Vanilla planifolia]|uniref:Uncharacterized protein n=1 Tax=Vanilla planifolia TaxID=51239 RepID=A0A835QKF6_VANPL|nr:hypothetical protein HPP92_015845 [Vanilla planifolia]